MIDTSFKRKMLEMILCGLMLLEMNTYYALGQQFKIRATVHFEYKVTFTDVYIHTLQITNPFPQNRIILTSVKIGQRELWLQNTEKQPEIEGAITWGYDDKKGVLILQSPEQGLTNEIEIEFAINLAAGEEISSVECKAYNAAGPGKPIYPISAKLKSELIE